MIKKLNILFTKKISMFYLILFASLFVSFFEFKGEE